MKKILVVLLLVIFPASFAFAQEKKEEPKASAAPKEKSVQEYIVDLSSANEAVVIEAEKKLGEKKEESATAKLLELCKGDKRDRVRMYAAVALGLIGDKKTAEPMSEFIMNELSSDVRYAQVLALSRIGIESKKAIDNLTAMKDKESDPFIKDFVLKMEQKFKGK